MQTLAEGMRSRDKARAAEEAGELRTTPRWQKEQFTAEQRWSSAHKLVKRGFQNTWESESAEFKREIDTPHAQGPQNTPVVDRAGRQNQPMTDRKKASEERENEQIKEQHILNTADGYHLPLVFVMHVGN